MSRKGQDLHCNPLLQKPKRGNHLGQPETGPDQEADSPVWDSPEKQSWSRGYTEDTDGHVSHVTSANEEPHHELCPPELLRWCRHSAMDDGELQPLHKCRLPRHVAIALLPVYQHLSDVRLLQQCRGNKAQGAAESLHFVTWSLLSKDEPASLVAVERAGSEAICCLNSGNLQAYTKICSSISVKPGGTCTMPSCWKGPFNQKKCWKSSPSERMEGKEIPAGKQSERLQFSAFCCSTRTIFGDSVWILHNQNVDRKGFY